MAASWKKLRGTKERHKQEGERRREKENVSVLGSRSQNTRSYSFKAPTADEEQKCGGDI